MKKITLFTNIDVFAITKELDQFLSNSTISNVYEIDDLLILKINTSEGKRNLIIKSDSRVNLTEYEYPIPKFPSQYIISLRKFLRNRRILKVYQHNFDRIVILELSNIDSEPWKFVIELFNKGNFLLLDENNTLKVARKYRKFRDRDVLAGKEFIFPQSRGKDFLTINQNEFNELIESSDAEIVRILARNINIAGLYSEEICFRSEIDKKLPGNKLSEENQKILFKSFKDLRNQLLFGDINACIIIDNDGTEASVIPFEMKMYNEFDKRFFDSFNSAVDTFYSKIDSETIKKPSDERIKKKIKVQEKILNNQLEYMEELKIKKQKYYEYGNFIYSHFKPLENMLSVVNNARSKGYSWEEIDNKLKSAKLENLEGTEFYKKVVAPTKQLIININNDEIYLELSKSIGENANIIYEKGKKADKKIKGTIPAIKKTEKNIRKLKLEKDTLELEVDFLVKKPKDKWFEKFRWFYSSEGFLVIGGRDASSNELIFKKYLDPNDLVFHTIFPGSPLTIIKNPDKKIIPEKTIQEAAEFVASNSRAWKEAWGTVDVFFVSPEQVSKSPPSGEFLPKGSFMIAGKKDFVKNVNTILSIGLQLIELEPNSEEDTKSYYPKLICGPKSAILTQSENFITIHPSKSGLTKGKLAKEIKNYFIKVSDKNLKKWINLLSLDAIILILPNGSSIIKSKT